MSEATKNNSCNIETKLTKTEHWDAWYEEVIAFCKKEDIFPYLFRPKDSADPYWFKAKTEPELLLAMTSRTRQKLIRIKSLTNKDQQKKEEKQLFNFILEKIKEDKKNHERKKKALDELMIQMKNSTAHVHLRTLNKYKEPYQIFQCLRDTYAPSELDRTIDIIKQCEWLEKCEFYKKGIDNWVHQWGEIDERLPEQGNNKTQRDQLRNSFRQSNSRIDSSLGEALIGATEKSEKQEPFQSLVKDVARYYQQNPPRLGPSATSNAAGKRPESNGSKAPRVICLCGAKHVFADCPYVNQERRTQGWKEDPSVRSKFDILIKKRRAQDIRSDLLKATLAKLGREEKRAKEEQHKKKNGKRTRNISIGQTKKKARL